MNNSDDLTVLGKNVLQLRLFTRFLTRFSDAFLGLKFAHDALSQNKEKITDYLTRDIPELSEKLLDTQKLSQVQLAEIQDSMNSLAAQKVEDYLSTLRNLTVVLLCSSLEITLNEVLDTVLQTEPRILIGAAAEKSLTLGEIVDAGDYESIFTRIREKQVKLFGWKEIDEKISFLEKHAGVTSADIFDWGECGKETQELLKNCDLAKLKRIFDKRHSIIHHGERPFEDDSEVERILEFFQKLVWNLCFAASKKFRIPIDTLGFYPTWMHK